MAEGKNASVAGALIGVVCLLFAGGAGAYRFELGDFDFSLNNKATVGATMRVEERDPALVSKLNNNPTLCPEDCLSLGGENGDASRNQRLVDAPGGFTAHLGDDGNLRFDKGELAAAQVRLNNDLTVRWGDTVFQFTGLGFYDFVNSNGEEFHPDNFQDVPQAEGNAILGVPPTETAHQPRHTDLTAAEEEAIGHDYDILEAFVSTKFDVLGQDFTLSVGEQRIHWGEALFNVLGSLDQLNPVNQNRLFFPGTDIASVFEPTGLISLATRLSSNIDIQMVYQYDWEKSVPSSGSSLFGFVEAAGGGEAATLSLGQVSEDPKRRGGFTNDVARAATSTTLGLPLSKTRGQPEDGGQYGMRLNWYLPDFNGGTELSFYALNYHSRLPVFNAIASNESCTRQTANVGDIGTGTIPVVGDLVSTLDDALVDQVSDIDALPAPLNNLSVDNVSTRALRTAIACGGFNGEGAVATALQETFGPLQPPGNADEPLPAGTVEPILAYPEDIHMFGLSFTTNFGKWALAGEYGFRPNQPFAVQPSDVLFAALQPALPDEDINILIGNLPSNRNAVPDYVETRYRNNTVSPNEKVEGFVRLNTHTMDLTGLRVFPAGNWLGANQIILALELGATFIPDLPGPQEVPLATLDMANSSHPSPGADGTGRPGGEPDPRSLNPTQQTEHYADDFSAGYRVLTRLRYNNLLFGKTYAPQIAFLHDVYGIAPFPIQNFVEGRKQLIFANEVRINDSLSTTLTYQTFFGGEFDNLSDRDNVRLSLSYSF